MLKEIVKFLKENPLDRYVILATLLEDDTISIAELVKHKEESLKKIAGEKTEELANACALVIRYKDKINTNTVEADAQIFLDNCSYTGFAGYANVNRKVMKQNNLNMKQFDLDQIKKFEAECEKIRGEINEINYQREAQDKAFEREVKGKQEELAQKQQMIENLSMNTLDFAPIYFKIKEPHGSESVIDAYKTKNISFRDNLYKIFVDKLFFNYNNATRYLTLYSAQTSIVLGYSLDAALNYIKENFQEITEEEYNERKKKIIETIGNRL